MMIIALVIVVIAFGWVYMDAGKQFWRLGQDVRRLQEELATVNRHLREIDPSYQERRMRLNGWTEPQNSN